MDIVIRPARDSEREILTEISFAAKRYWNYPEEYFAVWQEELTITAEYIQKNRVYVAEADGEIAGYFSLVKTENDFLAGETVTDDGYWLEHIFIRPQHIGKGFGRKLMNHLRVLCNDLGIDKVHILSDPHAAGF